MAKLIHWQSDMSSGEISPKLLARTDLKAYDNALKTMENAYPMTHGGAKRRSGTVFVGEVSDSSKPVRLLPFIFSKTISYILVFNNGKIQFVRNGSFVMDGLSRYEISAPYTDDELADISFAQSGNTLYIAHQNHAPRYLQRSAETSWTLSAMAFTYRALTDQWYKNQNIEFTILGGSTPFEKDDEFTITVDSMGISAMSAPSGVNKGTIFGEAVVGTPVPQTWTITCVSSTASRQEWVVSGSVSGTPTLTWGTNDYPGAVGFFEQRLYFGGTATEPQTVWGSVIGDYLNFTLGPNDNDAVSFTFASNRYDQIIHLESARQLIAMTIGGEYSMVGGTAGITPSSVRIRANTFHGAATPKPIRISQEVVFVQRDTRKLRAISYSVTEDTNLAADLTLFAEHITGDGIVDMTFTQDPDYLLWAVREDGALLSMTHLREQQITGWARHITEGAFENCAAVPEANADQTYVVVNRTINGNTKRYVEQLDYTSGSMTDCAAYGYSVTKTKNWSGLGYLEGKTVAVVADGVPHANCVVTSGAITLLYPVNEVEVGLPYTTTLELLHPAEQLADGSSHARVLSIPKITVKFLETAACKINGNAVPFRTMLVPLNAPTPPFTGDKQVTMLGWRVPQTIQIVQDAPSPLTVLGVALQMYVPDLTE